MLHSFFEFLIFDGLAIFLSCQKEALLLPKKQSLIGRTSKLQQQANKRSTIVNIVSKKCSKSLN